MNSLCQTCRKLLYRTDPCRGVGVECGRTDGGSKKSTAARMDVHGSVRMTPASAPQPEPQDRIGGLGNDPQVVILAAGTQAPPVDTKLGRPRDTGPSQGKSKRAAQMREYQRKRRERERAANEKVE